MAKLTLTDIAAGYNTATAHNANNALIEAAIENTLSRDGTTPNSMNADLDMNGYSILNQLASSGDTNFSWRGDWTTGTTYSVNNLVYVLVSESAANGGATYICTTAHTAGATFDGDLASYWTLFAKRGGAGAGTGDLLAANNLSDLDNATTARTNLGVAIGTDVQAYDVDTTKNDIANTFTKTQTWTKGIDVASTAALTLGDGNYFDITGTTAITSIGTKGVGTTVKLHFDGALTLTHHATDLILPSSANITTAAGDEAEFVEYAAGDWRCTSYTKASGEAVISSGGAWEIISGPTSITAVTNLDVTWDETAYSTIIVDVEDAIPAVDDRWLQGRLLYNNGASVDTASIYSSGTADSKWWLTSWSAVTGVGTAASEGACFHISLHNFSTVLGGPIGECRTSYIESSAGSRVCASEDIKVTNGTKRIYDGLRLYWNTGDFEANGTITVYGLKRT